MVSFAKAAVLELSVTDPIIERRWPERESKQIKFIYQYEELQDEQTRKQRRQRRTAGWKPKLAKQDRKPVGTQPRQQSATPTILIDYRRVLRPRGTRFF